MPGRAPVGTSVPPAAESRAPEKSVIGFMCKVDFDHELGAAADGVPVYPSLGSLKHQRPCVAECGVVRVRVVLDAIVEDGCI